MNGLGYILAVIVVVSAVYFGQQYLTRSERTRYRNKVLRATETHNEIREHAKDFKKKEIIKVNENIYVAIGYALANSIMLVGNGGTVIFDVTENYQAAKEIYAGFRNITEMPVVDIVYSHNHHDHFMGAMAFVENEKIPPNVWAHQSVNKAWSLFFRGPSMAYFKRGMRQFGVFLPQLSAGIGLKLRYGKEADLSRPVYPNKFVDGPVTDVTLADTKMQIVHIPGETDDQIGIWWAEHKAFLIADDLYKAFPNLYAIRGTTNRSLKQWVESLDVIIEYEPELLVPSHGRPVVGKENIMTLLTEYRDAIQFVYDQTLRLINYGYYPDEIVRILTLPENLARNPYLTEFYGTVAWSSKSVFVENLGWFSGDPVDLNPLTRSEKAERMVKMVGVDKMLATAQESLKDGDYQWALELATYIADTDPNDATARDIRVEAMTSLAARQTSTNGRNYYLTSALEAANEVKIPAPDVTSRQAFLEMMPCDYYLEAFSVLLNPDNCNVQNQTLFLQLKEPDSEHSLTIRNSVLIVKHKKPKFWDLKLTSTEAVWRDIMLQKRSSFTATAMGDIAIEGGTLALKAFFDCFDKDVGNAEYRI